MHKFSLEQHAGFLHPYLTCPIQVRELSNHVAKADVGKGAVTPDPGC